MSERVVGRGTSALHSGPISDIDFDSRLESVENEVFQMIGECISSHEKLNVYQFEHPIETLKSMRQVYKFSLRASCALQSFSRKLEASLKDLDENIKEYGSHVGRSAMNWGLNSLPEEVLSEILLYAAEYEEWAVELSHVCKRFRRIMAGLRLTWKKVELTSEQSSQEILALAESNNFRSLVGEINLPAHYGLPDAAKVILDLHDHLEELHLYSLKVAYAKQIIRHLSEETMPKLRSCVIRRAFNVTSAGFSILGDLGESMPMLTILDIDFVPPSTMAGNLAQCALQLTPQCTMQSLYEFLTSAQQLQKLSLSIERRSRKHSSWTGQVSLPRLEALRIIAASHDAVQAGYDIVDGLVPLYAANLRFGGECYGKDLDRFLDFLRSNRYIRKLELDWDFAGIDLGTLLAELPRQIEILSLSGPELKWKEDPGAFQTHCLRLLFLHSTSRVPIAPLRDFLLAHGKTNVHIVLEDSSWAKGGCYDLYNVESALLDEL